jgi:hypothetical protein
MIQMRMGVTGAILYTILYEDAFIAVYLAGGHRHLAAGIERRNGAHGLRAEGRKTRAPIE